jgi:hypothetical protein
MVVSEMIIVCSCRLFGKGWDVSFGASHGKMLEAGTIRTDLPAVAKYRFRSI